MKTSIFAEKTSTKFRVGEPVIYTDSAYAEDSIVAGEDRKRGLYPGEQISTILINTVLRQTSVMMYILCKTLNDLSTQLVGQLDDKYVCEFDKIESTDIESINNNTVKLINYLKSLNKMCSKDVTGTENVYSSNDTIKVNTSRFTNNYHPDRGNIQENFNGIKNGSIIVPTILKTESLNITWAGDDAEKSRKESSMYNTFEYIERLFEAVITGVPFGGVE